MGLFTDRNKMESDKPSSKNVEFDAYTAAQQVADGQHVVVGALFTLEQIAQEVNGALVQAYLVKGADTDEGKNLLAMAAPGLVILAAGYKAILQDIQSESK